MSKDIEKKNNTTETAGTENKEQHYSLNDDRRVKVLSPGMMVLKRFFRNRIAVVGLIILAFMFVFSFVGGIVTPYKEDQQFYTTEIQNKVFAGAELNEEYRYVWSEDNESPSFMRNMMQAEFVDALSKEKTSFKDGEVFTIAEEGEEFYRIYSESGDAFIATKVMANPSEEGQVLSYELQLEALRAFSAGGGSFEIEGTSYSVTEGGLVSAGTKEIAFISRYKINPVTSGVFLTRAFKEAVAAQLESFNENKTNDGGDDFVEFYFKDPRFLDVDEENNLATPVPQEEDEDITVGEETEVPVTEAPEETADPNATEDPDAPEATEAPEAGEQEEVDISKSETGYYLVVFKANTEDYEIKQGKPTQVFAKYSNPSWEHWLGTDRHGMDMLTRLMYGGRISLVIGLIVEFIGTFLGMIMGGIAGYFGKWVDNLIMRIVDIFYCIPSTPILIIIGAMMDAINVKPYTRLIYLMLILGFLNWPGMARLIRGQILSLREQEFMTATEAGGISVPRRIFKHLIPNVIPQIIVSVTMGMGGVIITEASLSFLGLGVKFPFASWGNIINDVNSTYVLQNYWFIWIPAGMLLLLTVLAFNLVGDGLRDAFDPKMKR